MQQQQDVLVVKQIQICKILYIVMYNHLHIHGFVLDVKKFL